MDTIKMSCMILDAMVIDNSIGGGGGRVDIHRVWIGSY